MDSSGVYGKEDKAAVGEITPLSFVGECALYPLISSLAVSPPVGFAVAIPVCIVFAVIVMNERVCPVLRKIIGIGVRQRLRIDAHERIVRKKQRSAIGFA